MNALTRAVTLAAVVALAAAACGGTAEPPAAVEPVSPYEGTELPTAPEKPDFTLTDTEGRQFAFRAETDGHATLLYFGYTNCPDICPVHLANISGALDVRADLAPSTKVVFVSVDPARDTPEVIRRFLDGIDGRFIGLTGTPDELIAAQNAAGVPPAVGAHEAEEVGHSAAVLGYGADDRLHVRFASGTRQSTFAHDLELLVHPDAAA